MFAMERPEFPVDTHVWHITKKLGWVPSSCSRESCYEHLNNRVPDVFKFALHVLLVDHGKLCKACSKGGGGGKSGKKDEVTLMNILNALFDSLTILFFYQGGSPSCPLRRVGSMPFPSPGTSCVVLFDAKDQDNSIQKIKREYHIKDEDDRDAAIKSERGHHDKISLGLFPSDVKSEHCASSSSMIKVEGQVKMENAAIIIKAEATSNIREVKADIMDIKVEKAVNSTKKRATATITSIPMDGEMRRSTRTTTSDESNDDDVILLKRRGAILR
jgi:predicted secreted protein